MNDNFPQNNENFGERKASIKPILQDMVNLSNQRAEELAKPYEAPIEARPQMMNTAENSNISAPHIETDQNPQNQIEEPLLKNKPVVYPTETPTTPTYSTETSLTQTYPTAQQPQTIIIEDSKKDRLKEKWSIALGFGTIPLGITAGVLLVFNAYTLLLSSLSYSANSTSQYSWTQVLYWIVQAIFIAFPIIGFILGHQYEKSTGKMSTGKVLSIISGIVVAVFTTLSVINYIQSEKQKQEYKNHYNRSSPSSLYKY